MRLVQRPRGAVGEREPSLQAAVGSGRFDGERKRGVRQLLSEAREIDGRDLRIEGDQVLGAKRREDRLRVRGDLALTKREPDLEPFERAAEGGAAGDRELLVLELEGAVGRYARRQVGERDLFEADLAQGVHGLAAQDAQVLDVDAGEA